MKVTLHGAASDVTGSAYHVQTDKASLLVDCGFFQGMKRADELNVLPRGLSARRLDAVLVTHAHLDHTGRLPLLVKNGFRGKIHSTAATVELADLILRDSAKVQAQDIERVNRKRERAGQKLLKPLYDTGDVEATIGRFSEVPYGEPVQVAEGVKATFAEAGHMLGSASICLSVEEAGAVRSVVFSGDLGQEGAPILKDAEPFHKANAVFMESTYGDREHRPIEETFKEYETIVKEAIERGGKILIPTFAVGRAQLLLYYLAIMFRHHGLPRFPVYLDSPMAIEATSIYARHEELFDADFQALEQERPLFKDLDMVKPTATAEESKALNHLRGPCMILAGAGMCNAGRIVHHLRLNLWRPETVVIIVGFQAQGTLGRLLVDGRKEVKIFGDRVAVKASVHTLGGFSAHAGQTHLLNWLGAMAPSSPRVILTHGEEKARQALAERIRERFQLDSGLPEQGAVLEI
jgi:metallo-beta-lactamase family protein